MVTRWTPPQHRPQNPVPDGFASVRWRCPIEGCEKTGLNLAVDVDPIYRGISGICTHISHSRGNGHGLLGDSATTLGFPTEDLREYVDVRPLTDPEE